MRRTGGSRAHRSRTVMKVDGKHGRSIWLLPAGIRPILVRGAVAILARDVYEMALAMRADGSDAALDQAYKILLAARPTAINLKWALEEMRARLRRVPAAET